MKRLVWLLIPAVVVAVAVFMPQPPPEEIRIAVGNEFFGSQFIAMYDDYVFFENDWVLDLRLEKKFRASSTIEDLETYVPDSVQETKLYPGIATVYANYTQYGLGWVTSEPGYIFKHGTSLMYLHDGLILRVDGVLEIPWQSPFEQFEELYTLRHELPGGVYVLDGGVVVCLNTTSGELSPLSRGLYL